MKLRYSIAAIASLLLFATSCQEENIPTQLDEIQVSSSYLSLPMSGGTAKLVVKAAEAWEFEKIFSVKTGEKDANGKDIYVNQPLPTWLNADKTSGGAGETTVTFTAPETLDGRNTELHIVCAGVTQYINVIQGVAGVSPATCAEVIAGPDSKTYRVTGVCTRIANTNYGNWYLQDATGEIYIYGTVDATGKYNWASFGIEVGDEVTVEGPKTTYNGTVELVDASVVKVSKSLIKVASVTPEDAILPIEGGEFTVNLSCKGNGVTVSIPDDAKEWLSIASIESSASAATVVFKAAANQGGDRGTTLTFNTTDGKKSYSAQTTLAQKGAILEVTVADFLAAEVGTVQYRLTGIITDLYASDKQGKSFYIQDYSGKTLVYRAEGFIEAGAKVGDIVTVVGQRGAYKDSPQMVSGNFEELKFAVSPISVADFRNLPDNTEAFYMLTGMVTQPTEDNTKWDLEKYGNFNLTDETGSVYIYGVYVGWGGKKGEFGPLGVKEGDELTIVAYKTSYKGLTEGVGYYFSHKAAE